MPFLRKRSIMQNAELLRLCSFWWFSSCVLAFFGSFGFMVAAWRLAWGGGKLGEPESGQLPPFATSRKIHKTVDNYGEGVVY